MKKETTDLEERLIEFASRILELVEMLPQKPTAKHMGGQLMRSGTSPALNYGEARAAESKADFIHKMRICLKELRETHITLKIIERQSWIEKAPLLGLLDEANQLVAIFVASIKKAGAT
jgi:four helix bundle protein